jgi:protease YdgD
MFIKLLALLALTFAQTTDLLANVLGDDNRVAMTSDKMPWSSIGRINIGQSGTCSGTLIAADLIATAAHCVVDPTTKLFYHLTRPVTFHPNYKYGQSNHQAKIISVTVGTFDTKAEPWNDWAVARLDAPLGNLYGVMPAMKFSGDQLKTQGPLTVTLAGYSGDFLKGETAGVHQNCQLRELVKEDAVKKIVTHDCDMRPGSSGGPIFTTIAGRPFIVAINIAEKNNFIAVSQALGLKIFYNLNSSANFAVTADKLFAK